MSAAVRHAQRRDGSADCYDEGVSESSRLIGVHYAVPQLHEGSAWELSEAKMPESVLHEQAVELLKMLLAHWAATKGGVFVARNLAVRWDPEHPKVGIDPDVCVLRPAPADALALTSLRTWEPSQNPPLLAIEVVSESNAAKDYTITPDKYAASGTGELWVFDPLLAGPPAHGGPHRLQIRCV